MATAQERAKAVPPPIEFQTTQHIFKRNGIVYETTVINTTLRSWRASALAADPSWSVDISGTRVCAVRLRF